MFRGHGKRLGACAVAAALMAAGPAGSARAAAGSGARCPLPVFGPGSAYRPVIRPSSFTADVFHASSHFASANGFPPSLTHRFMSESPYRTC